MKHPQKALGANAVLEVLGKSDRRLDVTLLKAWVLSRKAKDPQVCSADCRFVGIVWHESMLRNSLAAAMQDRRV